MSSQPHRWLIVFSLICFFVSRIFIAFNKLQDGSIGTIFTTHNEEKVTVLNFSASYNFLY